MSDDFTLLRCYKCRERKHADFFLDDEGELQHVLKNGDPQHFCRACSPEAERNWTVKMLELYSEGKNDIEVAKGLGVSKKKFEEYLSKPQFLELVEMGRDRAEAWHHQQSRINITNKNFNTPLFKSRMANLYGWADKVDNRNANAMLTLDVEQLRQEAKERLPELLKLVPPDQVAGLLEQIKDE